MRGPRQIGHSTPCGYRESQPVHLEADLLIGRPQSKQGTNSDMQTPYSPVRSRALYHLPAKAPTPGVIVTDRAFDPIRTTCCRFSSLKTLLTTMEGTPHRSQC